MHAGHTALQRWVQRPARGTGSPAVQCSRDPCGSDDSRRYLRSCRSDS
jgi:hypothetical protein